MQAGRRCCSWNPQVIAFRLARPRRRLAEPLGRVEAEIRCGGNTGHVEGNDGDGMGGDANLSGAEAEIGRPSRLWWERHVACVRVHELC